MLSPAQREQITAILDEVDDMTIATVRADGYPQATTVSFVNDGPTIYFGTGAAAQKAKNILANDKISITVNRPYKNWDQICGVSIGGRAHLVTAPEEFRKVGELMFKKFPQIAKYSEPMGAGDLKLFRVDAEVISVLDYSKGFGHTDLLTVN